MSKIFVTCTMIVSFEAALGIGLLIQWRLAYLERPAAQEQTVFTEEEMIAKFWPEEAETPTTSAPADDCKRLRSDLDYLKFQLHMKELSDEHN